ncbi:HugZ family pyridoxamine 5'-phosphate oxidase [Methylobrevis albus]|uniref:Pyridoxamine 5'-phosphate oxidase family protein n=1 Tax=Methylobrevis albus TaxID=2793297 RepID=A0A931I1P0_9HYPH|nr:pyridoxamine 5'-phosphate oxidase family protein [Methylobrevis albus]MBH0237764.1 pyridoxamine 5'-phosphate oxidase family protein [Methylobrevis albus]
MAARGDETSGGRAAGDAVFDPAAAARAVLAAAGDGALGTLRPGGAPFVSFVAVAPEPGGDVLLLISSLAVHTRNLGHDSRASLLLVAPEAGAAGSGDVLAGSRLTLEGRVVATDQPAARAQYLARHPEAAGYADFADFAFHRFETATAHLVAGFGRIASLDRRDLSLPE